MSNFGLVQYMLPATQSMASPSTESRPSITTWRPVRLFFAWLGGVSGEGSALLWVANHRKHHAFSDQEGDPHTPHDGGFWAHMLWMFPKRSATELAAHISRWAPDLDRDKGLHFLHATFLLWHVLIGGALLAVRASGAAALQMYAHTEVADTMRAALAANAANSGRRLTEIGRASCRERV